MHVFGICICQDELNQLVFGVQPYLSMWLVQADMVFRRFSRFFL